MACKTRTQRGFDSLFTKLLSDGDGIADGKTTLLNGIYDRMFGVNQSVLGQFFHRTQQILGLGQDGIFENRLIGDKNVFCGNAAHGCIQMIE